MPVASASLLQASTVIALVAATYSVHHAAMVDGAIMVAAGVLVTLYGFRVLRFQGNYERWYQTYGRHGRIAGPLLMLIGSILAVLGDGG